MCDPITITALTVGAATTGLQITQQHAQAKANKGINKANALAAQRAYNIESRNIALQQDEAVFTAANEQFENRVATEQARGRARAVFASRGIASGGALQSVLNEFNQQAGRASAISSQRLRSAGTSAGLGLQAAHQRTIGAAALRQLPTSVSGLDIGSSILGGVQTGLGVYTGAGGKFGR